MRPKTFLLAKAIQERKDILFGNIDAMFKPQGLKEKEEAWEAVRNEMIDSGFSNFEKKSWKDVRNHDWQYLRRSAVAKFEHNQKSCVEQSQYSEVDRIVFDIMGNEASSFHDKVYDADVKSIAETSIENNLIDNFLAKSTSISSSLLNNVEAKMNDSNNNDCILPSGDISDLPQSKFNSLNIQKDKTTCDNLNDLITKDAINECSKLFSFSPNTVDSKHGILQQLEIINGLNCGGTLSTSPNGQVNLRKRPYTNDFKRAKLIEDEIQEAKLQLLLIQVKREEALLQQDLAKVEQEKAKAKQERVKTELLERELALRRA